jgi:cytochrome c5
MNKLCVLFTVFLVIPGCSRNKSVWDGVYTSSQAVRGREIYNAHCVGCHTADLTDLKGRRFMDDWREDNLKSLFEQTKRSMPANDPATLTDQQYLDVITFILQKNGFPEGRKELGSTMLGNVRIIGRNGPQPLPNGAAVQAIGCLTKGEEGSWRLTKASPLVRTRVFRNLTADEMKQVQGQRPGPDSVVLSTSRFFRFASRNADLSALTDRKVVVAGRLLRDGANVRVELFRAQELDQNCKR